MNSGRAFSGYWYGPKLFVQRVTVTGTPWVEKYDSAMRSDPAFDAEYGDRGSSGSASVELPSSTEPYTSSVPMCTTRPTSSRRAVSITMFVPKQFVVTKSSAPAIERSTWLSAAKCTTASQPRMASSSRPGSQMSPCDEGVARAVVDVA